MPVITISREAGSGGDDIAMEVAGTLGCELVGKEFMERVLDRYGFIEFGREYDTRLSFWERLDTARAENRATMMDLLEQVTLAVARHGDAVIVGRSGFAALAGYSDVFHVRIQAPPAVRAARLGTERGIPWDQAFDDIEHIGRLRADFVHRYFGADLYDTRGFDLVVNTGRISHSLAARFIVDAVQAMEPPVGGDPVTIAGADVDPVAISAVEEEFDSLRS